MKLAAGNDQIIRFRQAQSILGLDSGEIFHYTPAGLVHTLFEDQARKSSGAVALRFNRRDEMTYEELNDISNAIARQLICGRGSMVPIAIQRSSLLVIALLAVLKTGAAYVLLSPDAPDERNQFIIEDTRASFVITDESTSGRFNEVKEVSIHDLVSRAKDMTRKHRTNLCIYQEPNECAYTIYTSGTTGRPKGVVLSHRAAHAGLTALSRLPESMNFRQLLCHSPNFSAAQRTILGTLVRGGTLCIPSKDDLTTRLRDTILEMGVTSLEVTPSMLRLIDPSEVPETVKCITLGGESAGPDVVSAWASRVELSSAFGLSEVTQLSLRQRLHVDGNHRLIGKPADTTTAFILKPQTTDQLPAGTPGELCLAGPQLADGYLKLPSKTSEVFIPNPFGPGKLYRTGDLAFAHPDGTIELIGRIDQQIKIDGQRVEPSESNAIIQTCDGVAASFVVSANVLSRKALVAIVVPSERQEWTSLVRDIRRTLQSKIPGYSIPAYFIQRQSMPVNTNGKVDIAGLVAEVEALPPVAFLSGSSTPSSESSASFEIIEGTEIVVASVIAGILSVPMDAIDMTLSFQELGGTSLDAIIVASKLRSHGIEIQVPDILTASSLREMTANRAAASVASAPPPAPFSLLPDDARTTEIVSSAEFEDAYPVTPLQEGIIVDSMMGRAQYIYRRIYQFNGVSASDVRSALEQVIASNPILRSVFLPWKCTYIQAVKRKPQLEWTIRLDISLESNYSIEEMSLDDGPLVRAEIVNNKWLILEMHHALFDFWSSQFLVKDASAILEGQKPTPRMSFNAYVAWQKKQRSEETTEFWRRYLEGAKPSNLSIADPESAAGTAYVANLKRSPTTFCNSHGISLGAVVHTIWALTLARQLQTQDVVFLTAFSGRDAQVDGILDLAGPTLCTVPMRVLINSETSILAFIQDVQDNLWKLSRYAHTGLKTALADGKLEAGSFNTMINVLLRQKARSEDAPLIPVLEHGDNFTQYPTLEFDENDPTKIKLLVQGSVDGIGPNAVLDDLEEVFNAILTRPGDTIRTLIPVHSLESMMESTILPATKPKFDLTHRALEQIALRAPLKTAIHSVSGELLSYGEFDAQANRFANWLIRNGAKHGEMIPLYMEKSVMTLIAIFGIMKAGLALVPLDPRNPAERNAFIVKDVSARKIVTDQKNSEAARSLGADLVIAEDLELSEEPHVQPTVTDLTPDSIIYAIYTSGSTGLPKGVLVTHAAVTASTEGMIEATGVTSDWNALWTLNCVFDAAYYDVFTIFTAGGTLCVGPQDELLSDLAGHINRMKVEQVMLTPTITKLIKDPSQVPGLKILNVCGERIDVNIQNWAKSVDVYNGYGPTEATILMTVDKVRPDGSLNSVGFPLKHAEAVILPVEGVSLEPVGAGEIGELCVRGPHLAQGYLNRPEQTRTAFIQDKDGAPLYRTGDLARWNEDGSLECFGRKDYQVKLNGFRIELGEIENAILQTGDVEASVVSVAEIQGKRQLVAFCIFNGDDELSPARLLPPDGRLEKGATLKPKLTTLSHYMMPSVFLPFASFPTLPSGKTNRKALTALAEGLSGDELASYSLNENATEGATPVSTKEEIAMQSAWSTVLSVDKDRIGSNSSFLGFGGDSIAAINVVAACRKLKYTISVSDVLANATLGEQAKNLKPMKAVKSEKTVQYEIPLSVYQALEKHGIDLDRDVEDVYPCGPGQIEFLTQTSKKEQFWNLTAIRELPEDFDLELWRKTTETLTQRNQILRTTYWQADQEDHLSWFQVVLKDSCLNFEDLTYNSESQKQQLIEELRDSRFAFGSPHVRYRLLRSKKDGRRTLCVKVDHGSYDGTLLRIFDERFMAIARGHQDLPPVHPFKNFVDHSSRADREATLYYWSDEVSDYEPAHKLSAQPITDHTKLVPIAANVDGIATRFNVTASTVFQVAYALLLSQLFESKDVLLDNLVTGRTADVENSQTINGTLATFLPFRTKLSESYKISELLKDTQANFWKTTEHASVGLNDIYKHIGKDRDTHGAKALFCFQPFEPAPAGAKVNHMRWIVMAQSKAYMTINYSLMLEVQKTHTGHRVKCQWDSCALDKEQANATLDLYNQILAQMNDGDCQVEELIPTAEALRGLWHS